MVDILFYILMIYFFIGSILILIIQQKRKNPDKRSAWLKYVVYFGITNAIYFSILHNVLVFRILVGIIILFSTIELMRLRKLSPKIALNNRILLISAIAFIGFFFFTFLSTQMVMFTFFITMTFDAFSQMNGQLFGRTKILPSISPNKTLEGFAGGLTLALISSVFIGKYYDWTIFDSLFYGGVVSIFAFLGDLLASLVKRKFGLKDFSSFIPGHGGFLDRFDSFIISASAIFVVQKLFGL